MLYTINQLRQELFQKAFDVYDIFKEYFGEEYTDLQDDPTEENILASIINFDCTDMGDGHWEISEVQLDEIKEYWSDLMLAIYVWWPEVTVTNEYDRSVTIQDLYAQLKINMEGCIPLEYHGFMMTRSTFNAAQWRRGYVHSHLPSFSPSEPPHFDFPCFGSGPIRETITSLKSENDEALWMLFCEELARYVTVESIYGVPHIRMETISKADRLKMENQNFRKGPLTLREFFLQSLTPQQNFDFYQGFTTYYLQYGHLRFDFNHNQFECAMSFYDYIIDISNAFIDWFNANGDETLKEAIYNRNVLLKAEIDQGKFYKSQELTAIDIERLAEHRVLTFKGQDIMLKVENVESQEDNSSLILNFGLAMYILNNILNIINFHYGYDDSSREERSEDTSSSQSTALYL